MLIKQKKVLFWALKQIKWGEKCHAVSFNKPLNESTLWVQRVIDNINEMVKFKTLPISYSYSIDILHLVDLTESDYIIQMITFAAIKFSGFQRGLK